MDKKMSRIRRATRGRAKIRELGTVRLSVNRTPKHIYAQLIAPDCQTVLASASTLDKQVKAELSGYSGNVDAAKLVGRLIAERGKAAGIEQVAFDRSGFKFHGRVKALADAARENGLQF
jgi:large subunit ribosomal protein L18